jgi:hypothetical protein
VGKLASHIFLTSAIYYFTSFFLGHFLPTDHPGHLEPPSSITDKWTTNRAMEMYRQESEGSDMAFFAVNDRLDSGQVGGAREVQLYTAFSDLTLSNIRM